MQLLADWLGLFGYCTCTAVSSLGLTAHTAADTPLWALFLTLWVLWGLFSDWKKDYSHPCVDWELFGRLLSGCSSWPYRESLMSTEVLLSLKAAPFPLCCVVVGVWPELSRPQMDSITHDVCPAGSPACWDTCGHSISVSRAVTSCAVCIVAQPHSPSSGSARGHFALLFQPLCSKRMLYF